MAHKFSAEPRFGDDGRDPIIRFNEDNGLDLSGWFIQNDQRDGFIPTEREMVAAIFRYLLDRYTDRNAPMEIEEDFRNIEAGEDHICYWEIPVGVNMNFTRNR